MSAGTGFRAPGVAVVATGSVGASRVDQQSLEEMIFAASSSTLSDAGLTAATVGSIVLYGQDQMNGRVISCMVAAGPVGGVDRDVTMIASSGEHALIYAYLRLLAGQGDSVLVVAWGKPSEGVHPEHARAGGRRALPVAPARHERCRGRSAPGFTAGPSFAGRDHRRLAADPRGPAG